MPEQTNFDGSEDEEIFSSQCEDDKCSSSLVKLKWTSKDAASQLHLEKKGINDLVYKSYILPLCIMSPNCLHYDIRDDLCDLGIVMQYETGLYKDLSDYEIQKVCLTVYSCPCYIPEPDDFANDVEREVNSNNG